MTELKPAAARFKAAAEQLGLEITVREMEQSTRTAEEAAEACGCEVGQIVKSLIFRGQDSGAALLLLVSGANRVDQKAVAPRIGDALDRPDAAFVREATGYAIGGIPPLGHAAPLTTYMDRDLLHYETVWAAAGTPEAVFAIAPRALADAAEATIIDVA